MVSGGDGRGRRPVEMAIVEGLPDPFDQPPSLFVRPDVCMCTICQRPAVFSRTAVPLPSISVWPREVSTESSYRKADHATLPRT